MKKNPLMLIGSCVLVLTVFLTACTAQTGTATAQPSATGAATTAAATQASYNDPFAYCAAVGTIDAPDTRYTGEAVPEVVIQGYLKAAGLENNGEPEEVLKQTTTWRCMNKEVYVCNIGANLPCNSKADTEKTPTQAMQDFCKTDGNANADSIPMSVTGHATIYSWHCVNSAPELLDQIDQVDDAGYVKSIWYELTSAQ